MLFHGVPRLAASVVALMCSIPTVFAQETPPDSILMLGSPGKLTLTYGEGGNGVLPGSDPCAGGRGLADLTECRITSNIAGAAQGGGAVREPKKSATAVFEVTPLIGEDDGQRYIGLKAQAEAPVFTGPIGPGLKRRLQIGVTRLERRLMQYRHPLSDPQLATLQSGNELPIFLARLSETQNDGDLPVNVSKPFDRLRYWRVGKRDELGISMEADADAVLTLDVLTRDPPGAKLPFRLRLTFKDTPAEPPATGNVSWDGGALDVPLRSTANPKVYLSGWYYPTPSSAQGNRELPGFNGSPGVSARIAADLFAGAWHVTHAGGEMDGAVGVAMVSENGRSARLALTKGDKSFRYDSFEMLATRDSKAGRHTLDIRFQRKEASDNWASRGAGSQPEGQVVFLPDATKTLQMEAEGQSITTAIDFENAFPERFRVALLARPEGNKLSGAWNAELTTGSLGGGGQQSWGQAAAIENVVVIEDQRQLVQPVGSYQDFQRDSAPSHQDYIVPPTQPNRERRTDYPFTPRGPQYPDGAQNDIAYRTLLIYGQNLPQRGADALTITSGDPQISYELIAFPGEGRDAEFEPGWAKSGVADREGYSSLLLRAKLGPKVATGVKALAINGTPAAWHLDFADANAAIAFAHRWGEHEDTGQGEFTPTPTAFAGETLHLILDEQVPIPIDAMPVELRLNGKPLKRGRSNNLVPVVNDQPGQTESPEEAAKAERERPKITTLSALREGSPNNAEYQTPPIHLIDESRPTISPVEAPNGLKLVVKAGDVLTAEPVNPFLLRTYPAIAQVKIAADPSSLGSTWRQALKRAAVCYGEQKVDFSRITDSDTEVYSRAILTEGLTDAFQKKFDLKKVPLLAINPVVFTLKRRSVNVSRGDHAAAILIRDEFLKMIAGPLKELRGIATDDEKMWRFYQSRKRSSLPFWEITRIAGPGEGYENEIKAFFKEIGEDATVQAISPLYALLSQGISPTDKGTWTIGDLVETVTRDPESWGMSPRAAHLYAFRKSREALFSLLEKAANAEARARDAGNCKLAELLLIAGQDADNVVARILPRLVKRANHPGGGRQHLIPDRLAQGFVKSLKVKGAEVRALEQYGRIDDEFKQLAVALATLGISSGLTLAGMPIAAEAAQILFDGIDAAVFGTGAFDRYLASQPLVDYAEGASLVLDRSFYDEAEAMRTSGMEAALSFLGPAVGSAFSLRTIGNVRAARRGADVLGRIKTLDNAAIAGLSEVDQADLMAHFADLRARRAAGWGQSPGNTGGLTAAQQADYARFADFYRANGMDISGQQIRQVGGSTGGVRLGSPGTPAAGTAGGLPSTGRPAYGRTGVDAQQYCDNCSLVAGEAILRDKKIVQRDRPQAAMYAFAAERNMITPGSGATLEQTTEFLHSNGLSRDRMRIVEVGPTEIARAIQRGEEVIVAVRRRGSGYHAVRIEGFARDASGRPVVSFGEGSLPRDMSKRRTLEQLDQLMRTHPDENGAIHRAPSLIIDTRGIGPSEMRAARRSAMNSLAEGHRIVRREANRLGLSEQEIRDLLRYGPDLQRVVRPRNSPNMCPGPAACSGPSAPPTAGLPGESAATHIDTIGARPAGLPGESAATHIDTVGARPTGVPVGPASGRSLADIRAELQRQAQIGAQDAAVRAKRAIQDDVQRPGQNAGENTGASAGSAIGDKTELDEVAAARMRNAIVAHELQSGLDELIDDLLRRGVSERAILRYLGEPKAYIPAPVTMRETAIQSLDQIRLDREGFEIVTHQAARDFHAHSVRVLRGESKVADIDYWREQIDLAAQNGREYFARLARQGSYDPAAGFQPLIRGDRIDDLRQFARRAGILDAPARAPQSRVRQ